MDFTFETTRQRKKPIGFLEEFQDKPNTANSITTEQLLQKSETPKSETKKRKSPTQQIEKSKTQQPKTKKQKKVVVTPKYQNVDAEDLDNKFMMQCFLHAVATWMVSKDDFSFLSVFGGVHLQHYSSLEIIVEPETNKVLHMCLGTWCCHEDHNAGENLCHLEPVNVVYNERIESFLAPIPVNKRTKLSQ